jgi:hypothetical protein
MITTLTDPAISVQSSLSAAVQPADPAPLLASSRVWQSLENCTLTGEGPAGNTAQHTR